MRLPTATAAPLVLVAVLVAACSGGSGDGSGSGGGSGSDRTPTHACPGSGRAGARRTRRGADAKRLREPTRSAAAANRSYLRSPETAAVDPAQQPSRPRARASGRCSDRRSARSHRDRPSRSAARARRATHVGGCSASGQHSQRSGAERAGPEIAFGGCAVRTTMRGCWGPRVECLSPRSSRSMPIRRAGHALLRSLSW